MERLVVVTHGWQSESTDGPKGGWSCVLEWLQWLQWSPLPQLLDVVWCSAVVAVVVVYCCVVVIVVVAVVVLVVVVEE